MPMAYFDSILVTRLTVDFNRENGGLVFQPFLDFRVEILTEDGHFLAILVFTRECPVNARIIQRRSKIREIGPHNNVPHKILDIIGISCVSIGSACSEITR